MAASRGSYIADVKRVQVFRLAGTSARLFRHRAGCSEQQRKHADEVKHGHMHRILIYERPP